MLFIVFSFTAILSILAVLSSHTARSHLKTFINENFYSYKYDYRVEWERFIQTLSSSEIQTGPERALRTITDLLDTPGGTLWIRREGWRQFLPLAQWSIGGEFGPIDSDDPLLSTIADPDVTFIDLNEETGRGLNTGWRERFPAAWLVVPIYFETAPIGFAVLQRPRAPRRLDWEDQRLLRLVTRDLGVHLVYEHMAQTLVDTQQLTEFNKRVAFAVHDLKNTAGQLALVLKNAEKFGDNPKFHTDMMNTIAHAAKNLETLIYKLRQDQAPNEIKKEPKLIGLQSLVSGLLSKPMFRGVKFENRDASASVAVGDLHAFENAIEHVLTNAIEASPRPGSVRIQ